MDPLHWTKRVFDKMQYDYEHMIWELTEENRIEILEKVDEAADEIDKWRLKYEKMCVERAVLASTVIDLQNRIADLGERLKKKKEINTYIAQLEKTIGTMTYGRELRKSRVSLGKIAGSIQARMSSTAGADKGTPEHWEFETLADMFEVYEKAISTERV